MSQQTEQQTEHADHPDLVSEQALLDHAHECLSAMQHRAIEMARIGQRSVDDENTVDALVTKAHLDKRVEAVHRGAGPLCFGRIDTSDAERWYIGRRHVEDAEAKPVIVDWRAPVAAPYYRATAVDPCGLDFRRRFSVADQRIEAIFDEDLTDPDNAAASGIPDPLLAELDRSRSGQMSDIVATIAAEQDVIIRAPIEKLLVVQGGPGTGKTAVGLHRAAFLLYQHRLALADANVLVIGPNPLFLRYIADVLPSLGEISARQTTLVGLLSAKYRVRGVDLPEVAALKGRAVMALVLERAVRARISPPAEGLEVRSGVAVVRFPAADLESMIKTVLDRRVAVNDGREVFRRMLIAESWRRYAARPDVEPAYEPMFTAGVRASTDFRKAVDKMWPRLTPATVIRGLYTSPRRLAEAATELLTAEERRLLSRRGTKADAELWTAADLALLDEAEARCDGVPLSYAHIIVDEAQDLSPMDLRMLGRRAERGSMTVLGDLAQATTVGAIRSWEETVEHLVGSVDSTDDGSGELVQLTELTVGYRVPAAILEVANRLLVEAAPTVTPARSVRPGGEAPNVVSTSDADGLAAGVVGTLTALSDKRYSMAVIAPEVMVEDVLGWLGRAAIACDRVGGAGLPGRDAVAVLDPLAAKGLEFDAVVVVEPGVIAASDAGLRHLYVAMTRAVQYLGLVHLEPLPELLALA
ncbi:MAG: AAA family ATPase [Acidimicrobiia bacterium]|nr:AAA family ATPase [Acidimicrobiia bacterium]